MFHVLYKYHKKLDFSILKKNENLQHCCLFGYKTSD